MTHSEGGKKKPTAAKQSATRRSSKSSKAALPDDQFRLMVEAVTDYAIYMLSPEGHIASWNPGAQRMKRYTESDVIGRHYSMFFTKDAIEAGKPGHELERARLDGRFEEEGWHIRKIGPPPPSWTQTNLSLVW
jgi:PAS domain-containing protein